jgi:DNA polymerase I-like protein with 3'-5' exonuclease and polymerase domains
MAWHRLDALEGAQKKSLQELAARGGPWSQAEREALLNYCESDVDALGRLLPAMLPELDLPRALLRGRYTLAVARMEAAGIPIDVETLTRLRESWETIQERLIRELGQGIYEGRSFRAKRFEAFLTRQAIPWPRTAKGRLRLDDITFREMSRAYPVVAPIRKIRDELAQLRLSGLEVGSDGRSRVMLSPFWTKTGRNLPSNALYVFGMASWLRSLVRPEPGRAIAYIDWSSQEYGIGAVLSRDSAMIRAYESGDPYLEFGKQAGLIPPSGTGQTHKMERGLCKACVLGVGYGIGPQALGLKIGKPTAYARQLLQLHHETYPRFWAWSDGAETHAMLFGQLRTVFGWSLRVRGEPNPRSLRNFLCQANGAEMLRLACCLATERGIRVIAPVHDALAVEAEAGSILETVAATQECMAEASEAVLSGFRLRSAAGIIRHPDRFRDERGVDFWARIMAILEEIEAAPVGSL